MNRSIGIFIRIFFFSIFALSGCKSKPAIDCSGDTTSFKANNAQEFFYEKLGKLKDADSLATGITDIAQSCVIPVESEPVFIEALKKLSSMGSQEQLISAYEALQSSKSSFREALLSASSALHADEKSSLIQEGQKVIWKADDFESIGEGFSEQKGLRTGDVNKDGLNLDLQDVDNRVVKLSGSNQKVVLQRETMTGASGNEATTMSVYKLPTGEKLRWKVRNSSTDSGTIGFGSSGTNGEQIGFLLLDSRGSLSGIGSISMVEFSPTSEVLNAMTHCAMLLTVYETSSKGLSLPIRTVSPCQGEEASDFNDERVNRIIDSLKAEKSYANLPSLISYSRNDESDKTLFLKLSKSGPSGIRYLLYDLANRFEPLSNRRFSGGAGGISVAEAKTTSKLLYEWAAGLKAVIPLVGSSAPDLDKTLKIIDTTRTQENELPTIDQLKDTEKGSQDIGSYDLLVNRQLPDTLTVNGHEYSFVYETMALGYSNPGEGIRIVVSDTPVFKGRGLERVMATKGGTTQITLNETLGGFTVDAIVLVALSSEERQQLKDQSQRLRQDKQRLAAFPDNVEKAIEASEQSSMDLVRIANTMEK